jgi:hypothetical protein
MSCNTNQTVRLVRIHNFLHSSSILLLYKFDILIPPSALPPVLLLPLSNLRRNCLSFTFWYIIFLSHFFVTLCHSPPHFICVSVFIYSSFLQSRDSSVGITLGYGLNDRGTRIRFPEGAGNFSLHHRVQNGSGAHLASYPMGTRGSFPRGKADSA